MSDPNQAYCACLSVEYQPEEAEGGMLRERWRCVCCGSEFQRKPFVPFMERIGWWGRLVFRFKMRLLRKRRMRLNSNKSTGGITK